MSRGSLLPDARTEMSSASWYENANTEQTRRPRNLYPTLAQDSPARDTSSLSTSLAPLHLSDTERTLNESTDHAPPTQYLSVHTSLPQSNYAVAPSSSAFSHYNQSCFPPITIRADPSLQPLRSPHARGVVSTTASPLPVPQRMPLFGAISPSVASSPTSQQSSQRAPPSSSQSLLKPQEPFWRKAVRWLLGITGLLPSPQNTTSAVSVNADVAIPRVFPLHSTPPTPQPPADQSGAGTWGWQATPLPARDVEPISLTAYLGSRSQMPDTPHHKGR